MTGQALQRQDKLGRHFSQRVVVVTGAVSGIGLALTHALLDLGARVLMADRDEATLAAARGAISSEHCIGLCVDVCDAEAVQHMLALAQQTWGRIDFLFNNAGLGGTLPIGEATLSHWHKIIDVNVWGVIHGINAVLPIMRTQGSGHIVNTSSISGLVPFPGQVLYNTSKFAVTGLSLSLRNELAGEGIRVSCINPGLVATAIFGVPILGETAQIPPPKDAIPANKAAEAILNGVLRNDAVIVFPSLVRWIYRLHRFFPELTARYLLQNRA